MTHPLLEAKVRKSVQIQYTLAIIELGRTFHPLMQLLKNNVFEDFILPKFYFQLRGDFSVYTELFEIIAVR